MAPPKQPRRPEGGADLHDKLRDLVGEVVEQRKAEQARAESRPERARRRRLVVLSLVFGVLIVGVAAPAVFAALFLKGETIPDELVGVWTTSASRYADRTFEITKTSLIFQTGEGDYTAHQISRVRKDSDEKGTLYTIDYLNLGEVYEFSFYYTQRRERVIRFENQPEMDWGKKSSDD